jgi:hypothetical protein
VRPPRMHRVPAEPRASRTRDTERSQCAANGAIAGGWVEGERSQVSRDGIHSRSHWGRRTGSRARIH